MRQINPIMKAWYNCEKSQRSQERFFAWKKKDIAKAIDYLNVEHVFLRTFSGVKTGETKVMTGDQAKKENERLFKIYLLAVEKNKKNRSLEEWKCLEKITTKRK